MNGETLGAFLKTRRDRTDPASAGIAPGPGPRRVPGLRREELAALAKVSVGYYVRIEQDQAGNASSQVLDSVASVMGLDHAERTHMFNLAKGSSPAQMVRDPAECPSRRVSALFESLHETVPAVVFGRRGDVLAWNRSGHALLFGHQPIDAPADPQRRPSGLEMFFLDPCTRALYRNWDDLARAHVAYLRLTSGRFPADAALEELIAQLSVKSGRFAELWAEGDVEERSSGRMLLEHPTLGPLDVDYQVWLQPESPDHRLEVCTPNDKRTREALRRLSLATRSTHAPGPRSRVLDVHPPHVRTVLADARAGSALAADLA